jgi:hypothetical protein
MVDMIYAPNDIERPILVLVRKVMIECAQAAYVRIQVRTVIVD